jgi:SPP1 gp7 family putative phage head morphogenesis protein
VDGTPYQPAPEVWRSSPERVLLWAVTGALHQIEREIPETKSKAAWESKLSKLIETPVRKFKWSTLWDKWAIAKDERDADVPTSVTNAWAEIPGVVSGELWVAAGQERADRLHLPFDPDDLKAAMDETLQLVKSIPEALHDRLREIMRDAYANQDGQFGFARQIRAEFADVSKWKAEQIAVTEWNRAASTATLIGYGKQGVALKIWYTVGDNRVCPVCENNSADMEIPLDRPFFSGDMAPPAHPGCRCDISSA